MIVPMKKVTVLVQSKDADSAVARLRSLGILHIEHHKAPVGKETEAITNDISMLSEAINILSEQASARGSHADQGVKSYGPGKDWKTAALHIIDARKRLEQLKEYSVSLKAMISEWERWGDFEPETIRSLSEKNIFVGLYQIPVKKLNTVLKNVLVKNIFTKGGFAHCVIISRSRIDVSYKEVTLPKMGLERMRARLSEDIGVTDAIRKDINRFMAYLGVFQGAKSLLEKELEFNRALRGMGESGTISYISGYVPYDEEALVRDASKRERWGFLISDPAEDDMVPTLIRNPRWVSRIDAVFKMMDMSPGYRELDISLLFLIFFSIFFGMLIGDAGLGAIYLMLTIIFRRKLKNILPNNVVPALFCTLSVCTIIWGVLSGTFFGREWLPRSFRPLVPALRDDRNMQAVCFFIGATHLSIAHSWRAILKMPALIALADVGWILVLWGGFFLAKMLVLGDTFPFFGKWLFISGAAFIVLFTNPERNILKGIGSGLGAFVLNVVNSFTDVLSYIRLFAVGLAGVAIADSFNNMAIDIGYKNIFTAIIALFVLLIGHGLNILLGPIAVLVHGVRLNILEFCNHLDIKWSGVPYKPLKNISA